MTYILPNPESNRHSQTNRNDVSGTLWVTKNINMDEEAYIKLAPASFATFTTDDDADFDTADAMFVGDGEIFINSDEVFSGTVGVDALDNRSSDTNSPSPTVEDDVIFFNGTQVVSDGGTIKYLSGATTWTTLTGDSAVSGNPTCLAVFDGENALMIGNGNKIDFYDTSWTLDKTITIPAEYNVSSMTSNGSRAYIATRHDADGEAKMFLINQGGTAALESYGAETYEIPTVRSFGSSVAIFTADGRWMRFNGGGFDEIQVTPIYVTDFSYGNANSEYSTTSNRGMVVDGNLVYTMLATDLSSSLIDWYPYFHGGVWCVDPSVGAYHRYSLSDTRFSEEAISSADKVDISTDEITVATNIPTGTPVQYKEGGSGFVGGLKENTIYYVINVDATTIKLATTQANAIAGTAIDLTSTGNTSQKLYVFSVRDYGQSYQQDRLAITTLPNSLRDTDIAGRIAFVGETINGTALNTYHPALPNRGYFITPKLYAGAVDEMYQKVAIKHRLLDEGDEIVVKYREKDKLNYPIGIEKATSAWETERVGTWTSTTTFTTTKDLSAVIAGEEIEIIYGKGAGVSDTITDISEAGGTYTVTLSEGFLFAENGDTMYYMVDNWTTLGTITKDSDTSEFRIDEVGDFIQLKVELRGVNIAVRDITINNKSFRRLI